MSIPTNPIALEQVAPVTCLVPGSADSPDVLDKIRRLTEAMFPGQVEIESDSDPEDPSFSWWNFWVESTLDHSQLRPLRAGWHAAVYQLGVGDATQFSLQVRRPS